MSDEAQEQTTEQPESETSEQEKTPKSIPYTRFKEVNDGYAALKAQLAELQSKQKQTEEAALKEQNKYKELYEQRENELKAERLKILRLKVGKALPDELAELLQGETEEELKAHAEKLMKFAQPKEPGESAKQPYGLPPLKNGAGNTMIDLTKETDPAKIREYLASQHK